MRVATPCIINNNNDNGCYICLESDTTASGVFYQCVWGNQTHREPTLLVCRWKWQSSDASHLLQRAGSNNGNSRNLYLQRSMYDIWTQACISMVSVLRTTTAITMGSLPQDVVLISSSAQTLSQSRRFVPPPRNSSQLAVERKASRCWSLMYVDKPPINRISFVAVSKTAVCCIRE